MSVPHRPWVHRTYVASRGWGIWRRFRFECDTCNVRPGRWCDTWYEADEMGKFHNDLNLYEHMHPHFEQLVLFDMPQTKTG